MEFLELPAQAGPEAVVQEPLAPSAAQVKRFLEVWTSGLYPKEELLRNSAPILRTHRIDLDPALVAVLYESKFLRGKSGRHDLLPPQFDAFREFIDTKYRWRDQVREGSAPANPVYRAFRERQIRRCQVEVGADQNAAIVHIPCVIELARGCSVKCWFCALDAPPLSGVFEYNPGNLKLFREVLEVVKRVVGPASRWTSSYWGTDPLDNPDQERFNDEFHSILGMYPQTTTAIPLRSPERVRRLLIDSRAKGCLVNRFSVRTPAQLRGIHEAFSAEELLYTELVLQNSEADTVKARAGRLLHFGEKLPKLAANDERKLLLMLRERDPELAAKATSVIINLPGSTATVVKMHEQEQVAQEDEFNVAINVPGTTSCLTGFKLNMVDRTVELLSPCRASEQWPLGHIVFEEGRFDTAAELEALMNGMIGRHMTRRIAPETPVRFVPRLTFTDDPDGFRLSSVFASVVCHDRERGEYRRRLGALIHQGESRAGAIALHCFYAYGVPEIYTVGLINNLFLHGMIAEEPLPAGT